MYQRLTFTVDVETDQELPRIGERGDWENNNWTFMDVKLTKIETVDPADPAINDPRDMQKWLQDQIHGEEA